MQLSSVSVYSASYITFSKPYVCLVTFVFFLNGICFSVSNEELESILQANETSQRLFDNVSFKFNEEIVENSGEGKFIISRDGAFFRKGPKGREEVLYGLDSPRSDINDQIVQLLWNEEYFLYREDLTRLTKLEYNTTYGQLTDSASAMMRVYAPSLVDRTLPRWGRTLIARSIRSC